MPASSGPARPWSPVGLSDQTMGCSVPPDLERILRLSQLRLELGHLSVIERELLESPSTSLCGGDRRRRDGRLADSSVVGVAQLLGQALVLSRSMSTCDGEALAARTSRRSSSMLAFAASLAYRRSEHDQALTHIRTRWATCEGSICTDSLALAAWRNVSRLPFSLGFQPRARRFWPWRTARAGRSPTAAA